MSNKILLVSTDPAVAREVEAIIDFLDYQLTVITDAQNLDLDDTAGDFVMAVLHLQEPAELLTAVDFLAEHSAATPLYSLQFRPEQGRAGALPRGVKGSVDYPIKYRNFLSTIREAQQIAASSSAQDARAPVLIGNSPASKEIQALAQQVAKTDATVLLLGESGTGKEVVARTVHHYSLRNEKAFVAVNCGAIPPDLLESELFGHEKGAFTGAISSRRGRFELAEGGTLFLDEIGDMPMPMQVKLLRVLQENTYERVGGTRSLHNTARIIAATHHDLEDKVHRGDFRLDLYYRLNVFPIELPPLRDRVEDIPMLIEEFTARMKPRNQEPALLDEGAIRAISAHPLPGNVRELENLVERLAILHPGKSVTAEQLPARYRVPTILPTHPTGESDADPGSASEPVRLEEFGQILQFGRGVLPDEGLNLKQHLIAIEKSLLLDALDRSGWVVAKAAKLLGLRRTTLVEKMRKFEISRIA